MATVTYTCSFSSALAFNAHPSASLSGPSSTIPYGAIITNVEFEVYCGVSQYNYDADCCATLTDGNGNTFDVDSTCDTGSSNRIWATWDESVSTSESASMDWNNLKTIELSGTSKLTIRTGYTATLTIEYTEITFSTSPGTPTITQNNNGTYTVTWSKATLSGVSGTVYYALWSVTDGYAIQDGITGTSVSCSIGAYNTALQYRIVAYYGSSDYYSSTVEARSSTVTKTYYPPSISTPTLTLSATSGSSVNLSWTAASLSYTGGSVSYGVYINNALFKTQTATTLTIAESDLAKQTSPMTIKVTATGSSLTNTYSGTSLSKTSGEKSFTYVPSTTACTAPTSVTVASNNVAPGASITLSWSGASAGTNNAISGYEIYRSTSAAGTYTKLTTVTSSATSSSASVTAPTTNGSSYYYKVLTVGSVSGYSSAQSTAYATLTCSFTAPTAPTTVTIGGSSSAYAASGASVTLAWSGASDGTNNAITGYLIYRDGVSYTTTTSTSISVPAHATAGSTYIYTVYTKGAHSNSGASAGRIVYTYGNPTAPTSIAVTNSTPDVGVSVTLAWSGASKGSYNDIVGYLVYRATSAAGTYSKLTEIDSTETSGSCTVTAPTTMGASYYYKVYTKGTRSNSAISSEYATVTAQTYTACSWPSDAVCYLGATLSRVSTTLSWSAATDGTNNAVSHYDIQLCESSDGQTWGNWTTYASGLTTNQSRVTPSLTAGYYRKFRVKAIGTKSGMDSDWIESMNTLRKDFTKCLAPETVSVSPTISSDTSTLSWSESEDGDGNAVTGYQIEYAYSEDGSVFGEWSALGESSALFITVEAPDAAGAYYRYRVRAIGTRGESYASAWTQSSNTLRKAHDTLDEFTDPILTSQVTPIKAIHITEMQDRVNTLLSFYGYDTVGFTSVIAGVTPISMWAEHITQIRDAIDSMQVTHDDWIEFGSISENESRPTVDVIYQLRDIIMAI